MADNLQEIKDIKQAQDLANEAIEKGNDLTRSFGQLLKANLKDAKNVNATIKSASEIIQRQLENKKQESSTEAKLKGVIAQKAKIDEKIAHYRKINHNAIADDLVIQKQGLDVEEDILILQQAREEVQNRLVASAKRLASALSIGAIIAGVVSMATKFASQLDSIGQRFGSLNVLGDDFNKSLTDAGAEAIAVGGNLDDVANITSDLASNFGISLEQAAQLSNKVLDTAKATGLSNDEASLLFGTLKATANISADQAEKLAEGAFQLARQAGVAPQQVLKDIAGSSETIATFTKDSGENLFEAAVAARQFGLNIDSVAKAARSTLDFQSSLENELQASVLLGTQLNLQKARQLALDKDLVGFQAEIKNQLSDIGDFTELDVFQQESLAKALGMSVGEVAKLASGTQQLSVSGALAAGNFGDIAGQEALSNLSSIVSQVKSLAATFLVEVGPSIEKVVGNLSDFLGKEENIEKIKNTVKSVANVAKTLAENFHLVIGAIVGIRATFAILDLLKVKSIAAAVAVAAKNAGMSAAAFGPLAAVAFGGILAGLTALIMSTIPKAQTGISGFSGGPLMVGESGPEIMNVPSGTSVMGAEPTRQLMNQNNNVDINPLVEATNRTTEAISKLQITAGRGEIRVAMEPALGGSL